MPNNARFHLSNLDHALMRIAQELEDQQRKITSLRALLNDTPLEALMEAPLAHHVIGDVLRSTRGDTSAIETAIREANNFDLEAMRHAKTKVDA